MAQEYTPLHQEIFTFNPKFVEPKIVELVTEENIDKSERTVGNGFKLKNFDEIKQQLGIQEPKEQFYIIKFFTEEFSKLLVEEIQNYGIWDEKTNAIFKCIGEDTLESGIKIQDVPGLNDVWLKYVSEYIKPLTESFWITFNVQKKDKTIFIKHESGVEKKYPLRYEPNAVGGYLQLNNDFENGGIYFPKFDFTFGDSSTAPGTFLFYPGGVSHEQFPKIPSKGTRISVFCAWA